MGEQLTLGTIKHRVFEHVMMAWDASTQPDPSCWERLMDQAIREHMAELLALRMDETSVRQQLRQLLGVLRSWAEASLPQNGAAAQPIALDRRMGALLAEGAELSQRAGATPFATEPSELRLRGVLATEQDVCSLTYGLKGKLDATVQVEVGAAGEGAKWLLPMPLELKTGKRSNYNINDHNAQARLVACSPDRVDPPPGMLPVSGRPDPRAAPPALTPHRAT